MNFMFIGGIGTQELLLVVVVVLILFGGKKLPELEALELCYNAINDGAAGVDMGRNVFQSDAPEAMIQAVYGVVHNGLTPQQGYELYQELKNR